MERFPFDAFEAFMQEHQRCDVLDAAGGDTEKARDACLKLIPRHILDQALDLLA